MLSLIVDKSGRVIAVSNELKAYVPSLVPHAYFLEHFDPEQIGILNKLFGNSRKNESVEKDKITLQRGELKEEYDIVFAPLKSENNIYFLLTFVTSGGMQERSEPKKFWIATNEIRELTPDKKVYDIFDKIKLTYPFSFIEKAKIQKEINELEEFFWLKDVDGKYLLVNESFSSVLGSKVNQLENKDESDYLPKYLTDIFKTLDEYVKSSTNAIIINGISGSVAGGIFKDQSIIELPLCDLDNNVVAIIGFAKREETNKLFEPNITLPNFSLLKNIPIPVCIIDTEKKIVSTSVAFLRLFSLGEQIDLKGQEIQKVFEKDFVAIVDSFLRSKDSQGEANYTYSFIERIKLVCDVKIQRIEDAREELIQIVLLPKQEQDTQLEFKARMYDALIEHMPEAMFIYDVENLKFLEVNEQALKLYGYKRTDFLKMDLADLYAPEDLQTLIDTSENKSLAGSFSGPWRHKTSSGTSVLVELRRSSIEYKERKAHLNLVRNVSDQAEIKKQQQILRAIYENSDDPIITTDKDGYITEVNEPAIKKLGYPKRELETRSLISLLSDDDRVKISKTIFNSNLLKTITTEVEVKKPSGTFHKASLVTTPIKNYNGEIESYTILLKLEEEKNIIADLHHTQEDNSDKIDSSFLSNMFHEILTPINVILGFTQEIEDSIESPNEEQKEAIDIIKENQKLLLQIMDNAVDYSALQHKVIKFRPEEIRFIDLLNELKEQTRKVAESKKVELSYGKISSSLVFETDKQKFLSLLSLFIKFAIQITKEKSVFLSATSYEESFCTIGIRDQASSISTHLMKALSDVFADDENISRRNYGFSRFSTKLAKKLIELLSVRKEIILKGNDPFEFALIIPLKFVIGEKYTAEVESVEHIKSVPEVELEKSTLHATREFYTPPVVPTPPQSQMKKQIDLTQLSCLYLEDQVDSQMLFKVQMKDLKTIEFAVSFEAALPLLKTKKFDFIVMDINLQGEYNGLDALRIVQRMPGYKNIPIIASTAYVQPAARDSFIAAGFTDFVSKPLLRDKLMEVLRNIF